MAIALLAGTLLALAGFLLTSVQGFALTAHLAAAHPEARLLVTRHVAYAIPTVLLSLFSQSMVIFFFIGTGRLIKDEVAAFPEAERRKVLEALRGFKRKTSPPATFAILSAIAVFVLGGAAHTRALPSAVHLAASLVAVGTHLWALLAEWQAFLANGRLMADPARFARDRGSPGIELGSMTAGLLEGRTALVTGAGVRVGRAIALALGGAGADVAVHYNASAGPGRRDGGGAPRSRPARVDASRGPLRPRGLRRARARGDREPRRSRCAGPLRGELSPRRLRRHRRRALGRRHERQRPRRDAARARGRARCCASGRAASFS